LAVDSDEFTIELTVDSSGAVKGLKDAKGEMKDFGGSAKAADKELSSFQGKIKQTAITMTAINQSLQVATAAFDATFGNISRGVESVLDDFSTFETAMVGVAKVTELTQTELADFGDTMDDLANTIPVSSVELIGLAEKAGQLGVTGSANLENFAETLAKVGVATDIVGDQAATSFVRILNVTGAPIDKIDEFASVVVQLGNTFAATESEIVNMTTRVAQATGQFGVSAEKAAALGAAMKSLGVRAELGGTTVGKVFRTLQQATISGGESLEFISRLTGLTGDEFTKAFGEDAPSAFKIFLDGLNKADEGGLKFSTSLEKLGLLGEGVSQVIPVLAKRSDILTKAMESANKEFENSSALNEEAARAFDTFSSQVKKAKNASTELTKELGELLAPAARSVLSAFSSVVNGLTDFIRAVSQVDFSGLISSAAELVLFLIGGPGILAAIILVRAEWSASMLSMQGPLTKLIAKTKLFGKVILKTAKKISVLTLSGLKFAVVSAGILTVVAAFEVLAKNLGQLDRVWTGVKNTLMAGMGNVLILIKGLQVAAVEWLDTFGLIDNAGAKIGELTGEMDKLDEEIQSVKKTADVAFEGLDTGFTGKAIKEGLKLMTSLTEKTKEVGEVTSENEKKQQALNEAAAKQLADSEKLLEIQTKLKGLQRETLVINEKGVDLVAFDLQQKLAEIELLEKEFEKIGKLNDAKVQTTLEEARTAAQTKATRDLEALKIKDAEDFKKAQEEINKVFDDQLKIQSQNRQIELQSLLAIAELEGDKVKQLQLAFSLQAMAIESKKRELDLSSISGRQAAENLNFLRKQLEIQKDMAVEAATPITFKLIAESVANIVDPALFSSVAQELSAVGGDIVAQIKDGDIGGIFKAAAKAFDGKAIQETFVRSGEILKKSGQGVAALIEGASPKTAAFFGELSAGVSEFGSELAGATKGDLLSIGKLMGRAVADVIGTSIEVVASIAGKIFSPDFINGLAGSVKTMTELPENLLQAFLSLADNLDVFIDKFLNAFLKLIDKLPEIIQTIIDKLPQIIDALLQAFFALLDQLPQIIGSIVDAIPQIIDGLMLALAGLIEKLPEIIGTILDALPEIINSILDALPMIIQKLAESIPAIITKVIAAIPAIIEGILSALPKIIEALITGLVAGSADIAIGIVDELIFKGGIVRIIAAIIKAIPKIVFALVNGIVKGLKKAFDSLFKGVKLPAASVDVKKIGKSLDKQIKKAGKAATKVSQELFGLVGLEDAAPKELPKSPEDIVEQTKTAVAAVSERLGSLWDKFIKALEDIWMWVKEKIFDPIINGIKDAFQWVWDTIFSPIIDAITEVFQWVWDTIFSPIIDAFTVVFEWVWDTIFSPIIDAFTVLFQWVWDTIFTPIIDSLEATWEVIKVIFEVIVIAFETVWEVIKVIFDAVILAFETVWEAIKVIFDVIIVAFDAVWEAIKGIFDEIVTALEATWESIKEVFAAIGKNIKAVFTSIWNDVFKPIGNLVKNAFKTIIDFFRNIFKGNIKGAFQGVINFFGKIGSTISRGFRPVRVFFSGLKGIFSKAVKPIKSIFRGLKNTVTKAFNPVKKVFNKIKSAMNKVIKPLKKLIEKLVGAVGKVTGGAKKAGGAIAKGGKKVAKLFGFAQGGMITPRNSADIGGLMASIPGYQTGGTIDNRLIRAQVGEAVLNQGAVASIGSSGVDALNRTGSLPQTGGDSNTSNLNISEGAIRIEGSDDKESIASFIFEELKRRSLDGEFIMSKQGLRA